MAAKLTKGEILKVVNRYVGVSGGYLGDFSYRTHAEFYPEYCELYDIDPYAYEGTTRERFMQILENAPARDQAKILRGLLKRYPADSEERNRVRTEIESLIARLETGAPVETPTPQISSQAVERAIQDAETLIRERGASSGLDRVHTALHGYLLAVCDSASIEYGKDPSITDLFKKLRERHPKLQPTGTRASDITSVLRAISTILDVLNPLRNRASGAHPNPEVLDAAEAMLVINAARTILHYLDMKL